jgi:hypothetical protein
VIFEECGVIFEEGGVWREEGGVRRGESMRHALAPATSNTVVHGFRSVGGSVGI